MTGKNNRENTNNVKSNTINNNTPSNSRHFIVREENIKKWEVEMHPTQTEFKYGKQLGTNECVQTIQAFFDSVDAKGYKDIFPSFVNIQGGIKFDLGIVGGTTASLVFMSSDKAFSILPYNIQVAFMYYAIQMLARFMGDVAYAIRGADTGANARGAASPATKVLEITNEINVVMNRTSLTMKGSNSAAKQKGSNVPIYIDKDECIRYILKKVTRVKMESVSQFKDSQIFFSQKTLEKLNIHKIEKRYETPIVAAIVMTMLNAQLKGIGSEEVVNRMNTTILNPIAPGPKTNASNFQPRSQTGKMQNILNVPGIIIKPVTMLKVPWIVGQPGKKDKQDVGKKTN